MILYIVALAVAGGVLAINPGLPHHLDEKINDLIPMYTTIGKPTKWNLILIRIFGVLLLGTAAFLSCVELFY